MGRRDAEKFGGHDDCGGRYTLATTKVTLDFDFNEDSFGRVVERRRFFDEGDAMMDEGDEATPSTNRSVSSHNCVVRE